MANIRRGDNIGTDIVERDWFAIANREDNSICQVWYDAEYLNESITEVILPNLEEEWREEHPGHGSCSHELDDYLCDLAEQYVIVSCIVSISRDAKITKAEHEC